MPINLHKKVHGENDIFKNIRDERGLKRLEVTDKKNCIIEYDLYE